MVSERYCEHGSYRQYCWRCQRGRWARTRQMVLKSEDKQVITPAQQDGWDNPLSRYLWRLGDVTLEVSTVRLLYVQIGVLRFLWLTTASVIGERQTNVSLTLVIPRGRWLQMLRWSVDWSKSQSQKVPLLLVDQGLMVQQDGKYLRVMREAKRHWWDFLTRG